MADKARVCPPHRQQPCTMQGGVSGTGLLPRCIAHRCAYWTARGSQSPGPWRVRRLVSRTGTQPPQSWARHSGRYSDQRAHCHHSRLWPAPRRNHSFGGICAPSFVLHVAHTTSGLQDVGGTLTGAPSATWRQCNLCSSSLTSTYEPMLLVNAA